MKQTDSDWMRGALAEAHKGLGLTAPNPAVGAVVVQNGREVGRGFHARAGGVHAEVEALSAAGDASKGATLYVTLEPCSTQGRTPPCTEAVKAAGITRVVVGCVDPNPAHAGRGLDVLRDAGIEVMAGVEEDACLEVIRGFATVQRLGRPFVSLKLAATLDGRIADGEGSSKWITGSAARERVQALRRQADAVLVGTGTVLTDNPSLLPRPAEGRNPLRIVPDLNNRLPMDLKIFTDEGRTLVLMGPGMDPDRTSALQKLGVETKEVETDEQGVVWRNAMAALASSGVQHVLCEGGGRLAGALLNAGVVDELHWVVAPKLLGSDGIPSVIGSWTLSDAPEFQICSVEPAGDDVWIRLCPKA